MERAQRAFILDFAKSAFCALPSLARTAAPGNFGLNAAVRCSLHERLHCGLSRLWPIRTGVPFWCV